MITYYALSLEPRPLLFLQHWMYCITSRIGGVWILSCDVMILQGHRKQFLSGTAIGYLCVRTCTQVYLLSS